MGSQREVVVLSGVRTAIGSYGGSLKDLPPSELAAMVVREAIARAGIEAKEIEQVVFGHVINTEPHDMYLARVACVKGGIPVETPALTLNRLCGSGLQAIVSAAQTILLGDTDAAIGGGAEVMSRSPYSVPAMRWGARMNDAKLIDMMVGALSDPFDDCHMGITAENVAEKWNVSREDQDALAVVSHTRAAAAIEAGNFKSQIMPVELKVKKSTQIFDTDENVRGDASVEKMAKLRPVFKKDGSVTAGNASSINDAAAAVVLMERGVAESRGYKPLARLVGYQVAGVEPKYMGIGPVPAVKQLLERTGIAMDAIDLWEVNEAFAAQALAVCRDLNLPDDKTNPNGSGISLGHPIGATGTILTVKAVHELQRTGGRYALVTMCIGGGQGIAAIFERI
ncbi:acetyl-CoA C-acyltransferase family protein [Candidatus Viridilinea mediisalina]|uniref:acetyl-CoA C-acetyltransferase n=1 Tax=Candidatus Viridilinea mediisalina TaxID=2024553 RepID=A0A2A6RKM4_9CHLR|nr:acetyl-CoA C-acyltransferase family protein [Candidatus Viridilinea mediisalina]PDW03445.1 acetyl-CoA acetyltransferase [Candidatus Viridilinea mediisalina]